MSFPDRAMLVEYILFEAENFEMLMQKVATWEGWSRLTNDDSAYLGPITFIVNENDLVEASLTLTTAVAELNPNQEFEL